MSDAFRGDNVLPLPSEYGYVVFAAALTFVVNFVQIFYIGRLRKKTGVDYPIMYSDNHPEFNCAQRVHQNTLEQLPFFLINLALGGIRHPIPAAVFGLLFLIGRIIFSIGYWTGKPKRRVPGAIMTMFLGQVPLFCLAISTGAGLVGLW